MEKQYWINVQRGYSVPDLRIEICEELFVVALFLITEMAS